MGAAEEIAAVTERCQHWRHHCAALERALARADGQRAELSARLSALRDVAAGLAEGIGLLGLGPAAARRVRAVLLEMAEPPTADPAPASPSESDAAIYRGAWESAKRSWLRERERADRLDRALEVLRRHGHASSVREALERADREGA